MRPSNAGFALAALGVSFFLAPAIHAAANDTEPTSSSASSVPATAASGSGNSGTAGTNGALPTVVVTAERLNAERSEIETQTGASTTTVGSAAITAMPGGSNVQLNPGAFAGAGRGTGLLRAALHVRGDHNDLQYRLNGIILPEGASASSARPSIRASSPR
jgi:hypothetical protein